ncbi:hypothetical protein [Aquicoccus sp. SU-CL01552]|uniref:hypothetical protein n=1 Tax=Aquicoccus sp. SU-CL01552 TaxID=3127656 RepID=UPI0031088653
MLTIYARSFMTATRTGCVQMKDAAPVKPAVEPRRWRLLRRWGRAPSRSMVPAQP